MNPDFLFDLHAPGYITYDIETYPNVFTFRCRHRVTRQKWNFEISFRKNDLWLLCRFVERCSEVNGVSWVGFNNIAFDYPVVHFIYKNQSAYLGVTEIYNHAMKVLKSFGPEKFALTVWEDQQLVPQIDLFKIHHFDNKSKMTGLKVIEFNMRMETVEDLPFPVGTHLNDEQADILNTYNDHDVDATEMFLDRSESALQMRKDLTAEYDINFMNCNDVKIGEKILVHELEKAGVSCYHYVDGKRTKKQTVRTQIDIGEIIFPYINFEHDEFKRVKAFFESKTIIETKGVFTDVRALIDGCDYVFGSGGLHMSVDSQIVRSDDEYQIVDVDVAGFYPAMAIKNRVYPAHLGEVFCDSLEDIGKKRLLYVKKDARNGAFKLAGNGVYGLSNNDYSVFLDSQYTMTITINGQMSLCMLIEQLIKVPGLKMIQANTDGVTYLCPRAYLSHTRTVCKWWESVTKLTLEEALYPRMFIRDVNNYMAEKEDGSVKRIGAYAYVTAEEDIATRELPHHKDWSARVVQMAAEAKLLRGVDIRDFLEDHLMEGGVYDFMLRTKVPRASHLMWGDEVVPNIVRYCVSTNGARLVKVSPPTGSLGSYKRKNSISDEFYNTVLDELVEFECANYPRDGSAPSYDEMRARVRHDERIHTKNKSTHQIRRTGVHTGWNVMLCNRLSEFDATCINFDWYVREVEKLVNLLGE